MVQNLYEMPNVVSLGNMLRGSVNLFVVLTIVDSQTDKNVKNMLRSYIKTKSKVYENVVFLYYVVKDGDYGKLSILIENKNDYPRMFHIWNADQITETIFNIDMGAICSLDKVFRKWNDIYKVGTLPGEEKEEPKEKEDEYDFYGNKKTNVELEKMKQRELAILQKFQELEQKNFLSEFRKRRKEEEDAKKLKASVVKKNETVKNVKNVKSARNKKK